MGKKRLKRLLFGQLPIQTIKYTLGFELEPGQVSMSVNAQFHASKKHPNEYGKCLPHVAGVIATPLYLGDDERNVGKIELVGRPAGLTEPLLVAVEITRDQKGHYNVTSFYPISETKVQDRRLRQTAFPITPRERQQVWEALNMLTVNLGPRRGQTPNNQPGQHS